MTVASIPLATTECPICNQEYFAIISSIKVCDFHLSWHICRCEMCHRFCFSEFGKFCPRCWAAQDGFFDIKGKFYELIRREDVHYGFGHDPRWMLVQYGYEREE